MPMVIESENMDGPYDFPIHICAARDAKYMYQSR